MTARRAADVFVECLEAEGVTRVFGIPGEETLDLNHALEQSAITFIPVRHEQGGAYMADMVGRLTGRAGVCLGTLGPGALNLVTAVADASLDTRRSSRSPVSARSDGCTRSLTRSSTSSRSCDRSRSSTRAWPIPR